MVTDVCNICGQPYWKHLDDQELICPAHYGSVPSEITFFDGPGTDHEEQQTDKDEKGQTP